ncbi:MULTISPECIES: YfcC family protein [Romboutsia]|uniref:C4-dicarboxylate anaerobic carrier n=1 Tax=Romboutsia hominis TaxID=1507512 RepID=A0A2P2BMJ8_9FIRM|nr:MULTISPECIES: YfcC family protein [Romboutsia]MCH1958690.1 YfcC family protein [Romboutsia hominis]MCH1970607.1 YfcC family protein [Romboutsia hominis]MDB8789301.1 YfcC family protein [Romboutsia sp. 1001216sp1]MDB8793303.1 YfcC family protein [Romboutsia sp. 1001216sp1]MDB8796095.1 YfcC family protein [Romboutsia sp. 1001216sp1]
MSAKKKSKFSFPTAYTVILIVMLLVLGLTYVIPSGKYSKLLYDAEANVFVIESPTGQVSEKKATQKTLDELGVKTNLSKFTDGSISKPVAIPGTYEQLPKEKPTVFKALTTFLNAPIQGLYDSIDIIAFVLVIGGIVGVINKTGAFTAGISALSRNLKGKEAWLIVIITVIIGIGGTSFGLAEETIAFYPIVVPIFLAAGYDALVAIAAIYLGSCMGTMASTVNPFSTVIASNTAGIDFTSGMPLRIFMLVAGLAVCIFYTVKYAEKVKKDPSQSLIYSQKKELEDHFLKGHNEENVPEFTWGRKLMLLIFALSFVVMVYGVKELKWSFKEMTSLFLFVTFILAIFAKLSEKEFVSEFVAGAADLLGVALIIGLARGITIIMDGGMISDTILYGLSNVVSNMSGIVFSTVMFFVYILLGFFISSSSGLAVLSMPIMAPLADVVGVNRDVIVSAYQFGQGLISFITPTGLILASLAMVNVTYDKWLKFVTPLIIMISVLAIVVLGIGVII